uniref:(northern house mosquito) hypothetical protein n=1 Tax=Culex pipiens TaxID=7175 RepID=A0A8D8BZH8_CULPI
MIALGMRFRLRIWVGTIRSWCRTSTRISSTVGFEVRFRESQLTDCFCFVFRNRPRCTTVGSYHVRMLALRVHWAEDLAVFLSVSWVLSLGEGRHGNAREW